MMIFVSFSCYPERNNFISNTVERDRKTEGVGANERIRGKSG